LAIVGDHVPHLETRGTGRAGQRFRVPLLIDGEGLAVPPGAADRVGGLHDLPATLAGLLGTDSPSCDLGVDLLAPPESFSAGRVVYSVEGDSLAAIYLWTGGRQYFVDRVSGDLRTIDNEPVLGGTPEVPEPAGRVQALLERLIPLNAYLLERNAYAPKPAEGPRAAISIDEGAPFGVSHRGNLQGAGRPAPENSLAALEAVAASAVQWVEVDVQLTGDSLVVLLHDPVVPMGGKPVYVASRTLAQLRSEPALAELPTLDEAFAAYGQSLRWIVELKQQPFPTQDLKLTQEVARVIRKHGLEERVIADSVSADLATSLATLCPTCGAGWDTPQGSPVTDAHLDYVVQLDLGWVFVHHTSYDADLLRRAHAHGVRVMVYTVNDPAWLGNVGVPPDALMSDLLSVLVVP
jgi:glycerophosphoryl diester phosphodiesterase